ncbi:MAG TPA: serine/threonine-protein kinase, partial [Labilithrix sp.]|nr:serine/threonine-protein kinase [Labilithrix sp.]
MCPPSHGASSDAAAEHVDYVGFVADSGSVSKMAVVRSAIPRIVGRYLLGDPIAAGGMATVHLGRLLGPAGFSRTVAVKRLHAHLATNPDFVRRFVDEARIASRVRHTNVVQTLDVVSSHGELLLVLDYVHGESLARLRRLATSAGRAIPPNVASGIVGAVLRGLHAAHESRSARGAPLDLVHRDVTPQNILVGADGVARVLDFGIAQAAGLSQESVTRDVKGKIAYMPPEQLSGEPLDRRADLFAVGVVLWEVLAGERLFRGDDVNSTIDAIYRREAPRLSDRTLGLAPAIDDLLARALAKNASERFASADAMARAVEAALPPASDREIADWVAEIGREVLAERLAVVAAFEREESGQSTGKLPVVPVAAESGTVRRDALVPPPLAASAEAYAAEQAREEQDRESVTSEAATPRRSPRLPPPALRSNANELRVLPTPLVLIAPSAAPSAPLRATAEAPSSGKTRIDPVERRVQKRTPPSIALPIPMPRAAPPPERSMMWVAMLLVAAPLLVMAAIIGSKPLRAAATGSRPPVTVAAIEASPVVAPPPPPPAAMPESGEAPATAA